MIHYNMIAPLAGPEHASEIYDNSKLMLTLASLGITQFAADNPQFRSTSKNDEAAVEESVQVSRGSILRNIHGTERNIKVHAGSQEKHIVGCNNYENAVRQGKTPGIFYGTPEDAQELVNEFAGKGQMLDNNITERVNFGKVIGKYADNDTKELVETTGGTIRYSKKGVHIVPSNPNSHY